MAVFLLPMVSMADPVDVQFTGVGGSLGISDPGPGGTQYYISPYTLLVGGTSENAYCIDFNHDITIGQTWKAYETPVAGLPTGLGNTYLGDQTKYLQMGYLVSIYNLDPKNSQQAIWDLSVGNTSLFPSSGLTIGLYSDAQSPGHYNSWDTTGWYILSDVNSQGRAQEFLFHDSNLTLPPVATPEPGTMMLLGIGMVGVVSFMRKKLIKS